MADTDSAQAPEHGHEGETRRDFLQLATGAFAAVGGAVMVSAWRVAGPGMRAIGWASEPAVQSSPMS